MFCLNLYLNLLGDSTQVNLLRIKKKVLELHVRKGKQRAADRFQQLETEVSVNKERRKWLSSVQSPFYFKQVNCKRKKVSADVFRLGFIMD